VFYDCMYV